MLLIYLYNVHKIIYLVDCCSSKLQGLLFAYVPSFVNQIYLFIKDDAYACALSAILVFYHSFRQPFMKHTYVYFYYFCFFIPMIIFVMTTYLFTSASFKCLIFSFRFLIMIGWSWSNLPRFTLVEMSKQFSIGCSLSTCISACSYLIQLFVWAFCTILSVMLLFILHIMLFFTCLAVYHKFSLLLIFSVKFGSLLFSFNSSTAFYYLFLESSISQYPTLFLVLLNLLL